MLGRLFAIFALVSSSVLADVQHGVDANDVILAGHDAVAYFTENKPVEGSAQITAVYEGAIYRFSTVENRNTFSANPAKYAPAYGGWCATGTSFGKKFSVDGKAFEIVDGKLYVNKNPEVHQFWSKDIGGNVSKANQNWPNIKDADPNSL